MAYKSLIGKRFGRLVVVADGPILQRPKSQQPTAICNCDCGNRVQVFKSNLRSGGTKSCGCFQKENVTKRSTKHGHAKRNRHTRTYYSWRSMIRRCGNPQDANWENYGGRGIGVCEEWLTFEGFLRDMGEMPEGLTLGRIKNDGDYEPSNCEWQTRQEQNRNKRNNRLVTISGVTTNVSTLAEIFKISAATACRRMDKQGWTPEKAFTTPVA